MEKWDAKKANKISVGSFWHVNINDRARHHEKGEFFPGIKKNRDVVAESKNSRRGKGERICQIKMYNAILESLSLKTFD